MSQKSEEQEPFHTDTNPVEKDHPLNDITLDLRIEVGSAKMKISELMDLDNGSIIQLNQKTNEPLLIYANDKPILKGQIISAHGKYHIRVM